MSPSAHLAPALIAFLVAAGCMVPRAAPSASSAPESAGPMHWPHLQDAGGFDPLDTDAIWAAGDFVRYWIEADAEGTRHSWKLELRLPELPGPRPDIFFGDVSSGFLRMQNAISQTHRDKITRTWLTRYCEYPVTLAVRLERPETREVFTTDVKTQGQAHVWQQCVDAAPDFGIQFLFSALLEVDRLLDELLLVVKPPSVWSVLSNGMQTYVKLELHRPDDLQVLEVDSPFGRVPAFWLPGTLFANGQKALECRFLITWRRSPLLLSMGVLRIVGHHPDDESKRLTVHVIAARRGCEPPPPDRDNLGPPGVRKGMSEAAFLAAVEGVADRRYRVVSRRGEVVDLLAVRAAKPMGDIVGAFAEGRLLYCNTGGSVSLFLEGRGFAPGPYRKENLVGPDIGRDGP